MKVKAYAQAFEKIDSFQIPSTLFGATHNIVTASGLVTLRLPSAGATRFGRECVAKEEWIEGEEDSSWFGVYEIELRFYLPDEIELTVAEHEPDRYRYRLGYEELRDLDSVFRQAFDRWKRTCRAVTGSSTIAIGDSRFEEASSRQSALSIYREGDPRALYVSGGVITLKGSAKITFDLWRRIQDSLDSEQQIPVWTDFLHEAERRLYTGDVNGAILSAATACETVIRAVFWTHIGAVQSPIIRREIDKVAVQGLLSRWTELASITKQEAEASGKKSVHKILDLRNDVIHQGYGQGSNRSGVATALQGVRRFVEGADGLLRRSLATKFE